jgi:hypothetical protein
MGHGHNRFVSYVASNGANSSTCAANAANGTPPGRVKKQQSANHPAGVLMHNRIFTIALLLLVTACQGSTDAPTRAERTDSAGIQIVTSQGEDRILPASFTRRALIGGDDEGPASFFRVFRSRIGVDAAGNLYVLDSDAHRVVVFDSIGNFVRTVGSRGSGPGEIEFPVAMDVRGDGTIAIMDITKQQGLVVWGPDGSVLPSYRIGEGRTLGAFAFRGDTLTSSATDFASEDGRQRTVLSVEQGGERRELAAVDVALPGMLQFETCPVMLRLPPLFTPSLSWSSRGNRVVATTSAEYEVKVFNAGELQMLLRRAIPPRAATSELATQEVGESMGLVAGATRCEIPADEVATKRGFAPTIPLVRYATSAPDGRIWVERFVVKGDPVIVDVFSSDGEYLGTLREGSPSPVAFLPNGDFAAIVRDEENDVQRVGVFRPSGM